MKEEIRYPENAKVISSPCLLIILSSTSTYPSRKKIRKIKKNETQNSHTQAMLR
jgi:hypothetical protein